MKRLHSDRGNHGLCKIFFGDWNDSLTGVGRAGRGESVWLSMAFARDCLVMEELAKRRPCINQPNLYFNGCIGPDAITDVGHAEHVWCTGSAAWVYLAVTEHLLGLRRTFDGIVVKPCFPSSWPAASITRTFRRTNYDVTIENPHRTANAPVASMTVDGNPHDPTQPLPVDGRKHRVVVTLGK